MSNLLESRINNVLQNDVASTLKENLTGLEKESLRVAENGYISHAMHPASLGAALTHPWITTDYSEALLEFITPPLPRAKKALDFLLDIETFVYQRLDNELLWTTSMPCIIQGEDDIVIAEYGYSNQGRMKNIYRRGLAWRYGKMMQVIAGIHFNHSFTDDFWKAYQQLEGDKRDRRTFVDSSYMALSRNLQRYGWLISYLFGSSPAICESFLAGVPAPENMQRLNERTLYEPYGTSLRMGDIGYTNSKEDEAGVKANYNSLDQYTKSLRKAISMPYEEYEKIGVLVDGEYRQLNANLLQIENEYYSTVRPKQILQDMEKPVDALDRRGIQYIELRSLDINAFHPAGLTTKQLNFLEVFMLFSLLHESPEIDAQQRKEIDENQRLVSHLGRKPGLKLSRNGQPVLLKEWATELLHDMLPAAELLAQVHQADCYIACHDSHLELVRAPDLTPSARIIQELKDNNESYYDFASRKSKEHRDIYLQRTLSSQRVQELDALAVESHKKQAALEHDNKQDFADFLADYLRD